MRQRHRGVRWPLAAALVGVCCSLVLLPETASSEHDEPPGEGYVWVATPDQYFERQVPLGGIHYDWWRCAETGGCPYRGTTHQHGTTRSFECKIPGGSGRVGLGHCGTVDMCPVGEYGDCFGEHEQEGGWSQVLGPHNTNPGQYDPSLCVAADNQKDVRALSPPTPGHYDCWPVPGTWHYEALCGGELMAERGRDHCGHWKAPTTPTTVPPTPTTPTTVPPTTTTLTTKECSRAGFVWFSEYGGCRPEDCSTIGTGYVRNPDDGWCEPAPPPGDVLESCVANFEILFPDLAWQRPFDEPAERREYCAQRRLNYVPVWVTDHDGDPQRAGTTQTVAHRALHITRASPVLNPPIESLDWNPDNRCDGADELNVHPDVDYDCLRVAVTVQAGFAGVHHSGSYFRASPCSNPVGWSKTAERVCDSAAGHWYGTDRSDDPGEWTVTVGELARVGTSDHLVSVPFAVDVDDWGDADWLYITAVASDYWDSATDSESRDTLTFQVARREGSPPSSDIIDVNIARVADLPYRTGTRWVPWPPPTGQHVDYVEDERFVEIARSKLLANDTCPADVDCTDPAQWPVSIPAPEAQRCTTWAFEAPATYPMLSTGQGLVGCDDLNDAADPSVQYWPQHWAAGVDTFTYETPGGVANVAVRFTDTAPAPRAVSASVPGTAYRAAVFDDPVESSSRYCSLRDPIYNTCKKYKHRYYVDHTRNHNLGFATELYTAAVALEEIRVADPDGDAAHLELTAGHNPELTGTVGVYAPASGRSLWNPDETSASGYDNNPICGIYGTCLSDTELFTEYLRIPLDAPVDPGTGTSLTGVAGCVQADTYSITTDLTIHANPINRKAVYPDELRRWTGDPGAGCAPSLAESCDAAAGAVLDWKLCLTLWPDTTGPQQLDLAYRACDERLDAFTGDRAGAEAAGRSMSDYCSDGTITVLLGDCIWDPTDADRAALAAMVGWHSLLEALPQGPPGEPWPPHPEVPGGDRHIVVANSPVWPRITTPDALDVDDGAGCLWSAQWLRATMTQMLPWVPAHRAAVEAHGGFTQWLAMWDRLDADQQAEARALHVDGDLTTVACPVAAAADSTQPAGQNQSYRQCRWELTRPGVWHWTLDAGYTDGTRTVTETLATDITWFRSFDAYTEQQTFTGSS